MPFIKEQAGMFGAVLVFRCAALTHILILFLTKSSLVVPLELSYKLFAATTIYLIILFLFKNIIIKNQKLVLIFLAADILFSFGLMTLGGGWRNAWYIYSFSTALMAAAFFKISGALIVSSILCIIYLLSLNINGMSMNEMFLISDKRDQIISNLMSYMLGGAFFGYPAMLIQHLHKAKQELEEKNEKLQETDNIMKELRENIEQTRQMISAALEPEAILKLLVSNQAKQETQMPDNIDTGGISRISIKDKPDMTTGNTLTRRELELLTLIAEGKTNNEIAEILNISKRTVETHRRNIFQKLGASSATHATFIALKNKLISD